MDDLHTEIEGGRWSAVLHESVASVQQKEPRLDGSHGRLNLRPGKGHGGATQPHRLRLRYLSSPAPASPWSELADFGDDQVSNRGERPGRIGPGRQRDQLEQTVIGIFAGTSGALRLNVTTGGNLLHRLDMVYRSRGSVSELVAAHTDAGVRGGRTQAPTHTGETRYGSALITRG